MGFIMHLAHDCCECKKSSEHINSTRLLLLKDCEKFSESLLKEEQSFPLLPLVQWAVTMNTFIVFSLLTMFIYNIFQTTT